METPIGKTGSHHERAGCARRTKSRKSRMTVVVVTVAAVTVAVTRTTHPHPHPRKSARQMRASTMGRIAIYMATRMTKWTRGTRWRRRL